MNEELLFSRSVLSDSLWPCGLQHTRLPCPSLSPGACSNSCPFTWWCHQSSHPLSPCLQSSPAFSSCLQSFPASGSFPVSWLFASGSQSTWISASALVLPVNIQGWFPLGLTSLISLLSKGLKSLLQHHSSNNSSALSLIYGPTLTIHTWLLEKP